MKGTPPDKLSTPLSTNSLERSSAPEFGCRLPTASVSGSQPPTVTKEAAEQHAAFLAQQVQKQADAEFATFQEQARQQVASKIIVIERMEEENRQIKLAADRKVASLVQEGQEVYYNSNDRTKHLSLAKHSSYKKKRLTPTTSKPNLTTCKLSTRSP